MHIVIIISCYLCPAICLNGVYLSFQMVSIKVFEMPSYVVVTVSQSWPKLSFVVLYSKTVCKRRADSLSVNVQISHLILEDSFGNFYLISYLRGHKFFQQLIAHSKKMNN